MKNLNEKCHDEKIHYLKFSKEVGLAGQTFTINYNRNFYHKL